MKHSPAPTPASASGMPAVSTPPPPPPPRPPACPGCPALPTYLWNPRRALQLVHSRGCRDMAETVALDAHPPKPVLPPHLHMQLGPPREPAAGVVHIDGVSPCRQLPGERAVALRLPLRRPLQQLEARARHDAPLRPAAQRPCQRVCLPRRLAGPQTVPPEIPGGGRGGGGWSDARAHTRLSQLRAAARGPSDGTARCSAFQGTQCLTVQRLSNPRHEDEGAVNATRLV